MTSVGNIVMHVKDAQRAARFWAQALDYVPAQHNPLFLVPRNGQGVAILLDESDRMHLDLHTANGEEQRAQVDRLVAAGARRVEWTYPDDADFIVLADTEDNLFCVVDMSRTQ